MKVPTTKCWFPNWFAESNVLLSELPWSITWPCNESHHGAQFVWVSHPGVFQHWLIEIFWLALPEIKSKTFCLKECPSITALWPFSIVEVHTWPMSQSSIAKWVPRSHVRAPHNFLQLRLLFYSLHSKTNCVIPYNPFIQEFLASIM